MCVFSKYTNQIKFQKYKSGITLQSLCMFMGRGVAICMFMGRGVAEGILL